MQLRDVADDSFVLVPASWLVGLARRFLERAEYTHVIVAREEPARHYYYLYTRLEALETLARQAAEVSVFQAFDLHEWKETESRDAAAAAFAAPGRAVVLDQGRVLGFRDDAAPRTETVRRPGFAGAGPFEAYPALDAPRQVAPQVPFTIYVGFRNEPDSDLEAGDRIVIPEPRPGDVCQVLLISDGIELDCYAVPLPLQNNVCVRVTGKARPDRDEAVIHAQYLYEGQPIGAARRTVRVAKQNGPEPSGPPPASAASRRNPCRVALPELGQYADLVVTVKFSAHDQVLRWAFSAPNPPITDTPPPGRPLEGARDFAAQLIRDLKTENHTGPGAGNILRNLGQQVFRLIPREFSGHLRRVRDAIGHTPRVLLLTNEAFVPWELALLAEPLDAGALPFLACQTHMGRWLDDEHVALPPPAGVEVKRFFAVAARYGLGSDQRELKEAVAERATLEARWQAVPLEADRKCLDALITGQPQADTVHFAVHGVSDPQLNHQSLLLADGTVKQAAALVGDYTCGDTPRFAFVFLNACQVGMPGTSLGQAAGFPGVLVRGGARGFLAPLWEVDDQPARAFAEAFYEATLGQNRPVAEILQAQRNTYRAGGPTTPLAYVYYGNPSLRLHRRPAPGGTP